MKNFEKNRLKMEKKVLDGEMSKKEFKKWLESQAISREHHQELLEVLIEHMNKSNEAAAALANGYVPEAWAHHANGTMYMVEKHIGAVTSFTLYNKESIAHLIAKNPDLLPKIKVNKKKDYKWNKKKFNSAITQGILQGESIDKIAKRVKTVVGMNWKTAVRNARTAVNSAMSAGTMMGLQFAESIGLSVTKIWVATLDDRTRHSHVFLDGQEKPINEPFESLYGYIMRPSDPNAEPEDVYNCRCDMIGGFPEVDYKLDDLNVRASKLDENITYDDWKEMHMKQWEEKQQRKKKAV